MTTSALLVVTGLGAVALLLVAAMRPALACAVLILVVPLTTGLARGSAIPLVKPSEAAVGVVFAGALLKWLLVPGERRDVGNLDLSVGVFAAVSVIVPIFVLLFTHTAVDVNTWRVVVSPLQLLFVYLLFAVNAFNRDELEQVLRMSLIGGAIVGAVAVLEAANVPGVRAAVTAVYPQAPQPAWDTTFRPDSLVGHYSAVGGLCLLNFILALTLAAIRHPRFSSRFLVLAMLTNLIGIIASETIAPFLVLLPASLLVLGLAHRVPREALAMAGALAAGVIALWPVVSGRITSQGLLVGGQFSVATPQSITVRIAYWREFIIPALRDHLWLGTGTVIPGTVPDPLTSYVDNEYLWAGFRAGIPGIAVIGLLLGVIIWIGFGQRRSPDPTRRAIGLAAAVSSICLALVGLTAQYITFGGVLQTFGMLAGILAFFTVERTPPSHALVIRPRGQADHY